MDYPSFVTAALSYAICRVPVPILAAGGGGGGGDGGGGRTPVVRPASIYLSCDLKSAVVLLQ